MVLGLDLELDVTAKMCVGALAEAGRAMLGGRLDRGTDEGKCEEIAWIAASIL